MQQQFPIVLAAGSSNLPFTTIGGNNQTYPQGRKVTQWQVNDNLIWTLPRHTLKFGINTRRVDLSNYDLGQGAVPLVTVNDLAQFTYRAAYTATQRFPLRMRERVANGNFEFYAMDSYKPSAKLTLTAGMRMTWNTNVLDDHGLFARPSGSFLDMEHSNAQPLNQVILTGVHNLFPATTVHLSASRVLRLSAETAHCRSRGLREKTAHSLRVFSSMVATPNFNNRRFPYERKRGQLVRMVLPGPTLSEFYV